MVQSIGYAYFAPQTGQAGSCVKHTLFSWGDPGNHSQSSVPSYPGARPLCPPTREPGPCAVADSPASLLWIENLAGIKWIVFQLGLQEMLAQRIGFMGLSCSKTQSVISLALKDCNVTVVTLLLLLLLDEAWMTMTLRPVGIEQNCIIVDNL